MLICSVATVTARLRTRDTRETAIVWIVACLFNFFLFTALTLMQSSEFALVLSVQFFFPAGNRHQLGLEPFQC